MNLSTCRDGRGLLGVNGEEEGEAAPHLARRQRRRRLGQGFNQGETKALALERKRLWCSTRSGAEKGFSLSPLLHHPFQTDGPPNCVCTSFTAVPPSSSLRFLSLLRRFVFCIKRSPSSFTAVSGGLSASRGVLTLDSIFFFPKPPLQMRERASLWKWRRFGPWREEAVSY